MLGENPITTMSSECAAARDVGMENDGKCF